MPRHPSLPAVCLYGGETARDLSQVLSLLKLHAANSRGSRPSIRREVILRPFVFGLQMDDPMTNPTSTPGAISLYVEDVEVIKRSYMRAFQRPIV